MKPEFFRSNRARLVERLKGGVVVLSAYTSQQRRDDMAFAFEQESNFWYLTGVERADWRVVIDGTRQKTWLVAPHVDSVHQTFDGSLRPDDAARESGVDEVIDHVAGERLLRDLARRHSVVYTVGDPPYAGHFDFALNPSIRKLSTELGRIFTDVQDCQNELAELRAIKQPEEIAALKKAVALTCQAFDTVKSQFASFRYEYEIEAEFSYLFRKAGAAGHAYDPIVAAGSNAETLHYVANQTRLKKGQLVLLDIGARYRGYAADISRTYAYGEISHYARSVHRAVSDAQREIIAAIEPGLPLAEYQRIVDRTLLAALRSLGLAAPGDTESLRRYMPHSIGHGLGIDVHDRLGMPRTLQPGMVMTVEPGIYIPEKHIGVRIEDDILITETGRQNLSAKLSTDY